MGVNQYLFHYRDDGLAISFLTPRNTEKVKKEICRIFEKNGLRVEIKANLKTVDFLDVTLDIETGIFKPFVKPNNIPLYVHKHSNHPPSVINNIPKSINRRLSSISSNEEVFNQSVKIHQEALEKSGYDHKLKFEPVIFEEKKNKNRSRNITYFNPPFSQSVKTKVGKEFLKILDSSFPRDNPLRKIFTRNTVKVTFKCMPNIAQVVSRHNQTINREEEHPTRLCNCQRGTSCPVEGQCLRGPVIYRAAITANGKTEYYTGLAGNNFKERVNKHNSDFRNSNKRHSTTLSKHLWELKDGGTNFDLKWSIVQNASTYNHTTKKCRLCNTEKFLIMFNPEGATLNDRSEFYSTCRHRLKNLLSKVKVQ